MGVPRGYLGSWFPTIEGRIDRSLIGDGTDYPVTWDNAPGAITADQMVQFEWTTAKVRLTIAGNVTLVFNDYTLHGAPDQPMTTPFSFTLDGTGVIDTTPGGGGEVDDPPTPATWDGLEQNDLMRGSHRFLAIDNTQFIPVTLPWGRDNFVFVFYFDIEDLLSVDGSSFSSYVKKMVAAIGVTTSFFYSGVVASTSKTEPTEIDEGTFATPFPTDLGAQTIFHGAPHMWGQTCGTGGGGSSITITNLTLVVVDKFTQPADIA
jgi:hypothetical protein